MATYEHSVFALYGPNVTENDSYKAADGKGLFERFNEVLGKDLDDYTVAAVKNYLDNLIVPETMQAKFIPFLLREVGFTPELYLDRDGFVRLMSLLQYIMDTRGLKNCFDVLFRLIGVTDYKVVGHEGYSVKGFDSVERLDSDLRTLDSHSTKNFFFDFYTYGDMPLTDNLIESILDILQFNLPYYVILVHVYYNDVEIWVSPNVDLYTGDNANTIEDFNIYVN